MFINVASKLPLKFIQRCAKKCTKENVCGQLLLEKVFAWEKREFWSVLASFGWVLVTFLSCKRFTCCVFTKLLKSKLIIGSRIDIALLPLVIHPHNFIQRAERRIKHKEYITKVILQVAVALPTNLEHTLEVICVYMHNFFFSDIV